MRIQHWKGLKFDCIHSFPPMSGHLLSNMLFTTSRYCLPNYHIALYLTSFEKHSLYNNTFSLPEGVFEEKEPCIRALDKVRNFISKMPTSSPKPMFDHLLESSHWDDSNKWSNIGFGEEITQVESVEVHFTQLIWSSVLGNTSCLYHMK